MSGNTCVSAWRSSDRHEWTFEFLKGCTPFLWSILTTPLTVILVCVRPTSGPYLAAAAGSSLILLLVALKPISTDANLSATRQTVLAIVIACGWPQDTKRYTSRLDVNCTIEDHHRLFIDDEEVSWQRSDVDVRRSSLPIVADFARGRLCPIRLL